MAAYESFAEVYDLFMDNVPYDVWKDNLLGILARYKITEGLVAELGCGTGKMTRRLAESGYDMIGIDNSYEMLGIAMEYPAEGILYLCQDMRAFELYGTVAAVVSVCDSMNYIVEYADLVEVIRLVNNYLDPGGIFVFDLNTPYKYRSQLADNSASCHNAVVVRHSDVHFLPTVMYAEGEVADVVERQQHGLSEKK